MSIDKNKVKKKVKELRKVANNPILNAIANTFMRIAREPQITLDATREQIYNFVIVYKEIRTLGQNFPIILKL